jgi:hypothetical protein
LSRIGELDIQIEDVAEKGKAELRLKQKPAAVKKASCHYTQRSDETAPV